jgi:hypothetical protein
LKISSSFLFELAELSVGDEEEEEEEDKEEVSKLVSSGESRNDFPSPAIGSPWKHRCKNLPGSVDRE